MYRADGLAFCTIDLAVCNMCDAEISDFQGAVTQKHNVLRLDIPVDDLAAMCMLQCFGDLRRENRDFFGRQRASAFQIFFQSNAVNELHNDVFQFFGLGHIVNSHNVGMRQHCNSLRLLVELSTKFVVGHIFIFQDFDRNIAIQTVAFGLEYHGHAADADDLFDLISAVQHFSNESLHYASPSKAATTRVILSCPPRCFAISASRSQAVLASSDWKIS